ncbi:MAG: hypothetical protein JNN15_21075, partial [Blastocatellia bacterium]|nr:hypothetical protein [Blastocatellia bacterium]
MTVFTFTLQLLEPLMVTGLEGDPNSNVTLDYIPGSVIRGALISQYLKTKPANYSFDPANKAQDEYKLFFNGSVRYLNAYPSMEHHLEKIRTLPTPLSWVVQKDSKPETDIYDMCCSLLPDEQTKPLSKHFFYQQGKLVWTTKPEHQLTIHTQRERRHGRSTESDGAVFRYESLEAYSQFIGVILVEDDSLTTSIEELLKNKELNLGGSRTAGYGRVNVIDWKEKQDWKEAGEVNDIEEDSTFTITLLSNALVRNDEGQYQLDLPI